MEQELFDIFSDCVNKSNENKSFKINIEHVIRTIYNYKKNKSLKKFVIVKDKLLDSNRLAMYSPIEKRIFIYGLFYNFFIMINSNFIRCSSYLCFI